MRSQMQKVAFSFGDFKQIATSTPVMTAGAMVALEGGTGLLSSGVSKLKNMYERNRSYKEMMEMSPELRSKDQATVKRYFNSLHRLNPHFMNDPLVASGIVQQAVESQEAMGGLKAPALAVSRMAGDLVKNRSDFASALQREGPSGPNIAQHLRPLIHAGFEHAANVRLGMTPEGQQLRALKEETEKHRSSLDALRQQEFKEMKAKDVAGFQAARAHRLQQLGSLGAQIGAAEARAAGAQQAAQEAQGRQERFEAAFGARPSLTRELQRRGIPVSTPRTVMSIPASGLPPRGPAR
jgi:hypothetical protein